MKNIRYQLVILMTGVLSVFSACFESLPQHKAKPDTTKYTKLRNSLNEIISKHDAQVGLSVIDIESGDTFSINGSLKFPMQSVYKFPMALALMNKAERGEILLNQKVFLRDTMLKRFSWSPLKAQNPGCNFYMSADSVLMYMISYSDNLACDLIIDLIGGTGIADTYMQTIGFSEIGIKYTEEEMGQDFDRMYKNSTTPTAMSSLLSAFFKNEIVSEYSVNHLLNLMINDSTSHNRIIGGVPKGTTVAHKTGTGRYTDSSVSACNDVGIIYLPDGRHLAVSIFVMNAAGSFSDSEKLIAALSKEIFDQLK